MNNPGVPLISIGIICNIIRRLEVSDIKLGEDVLEQIDCVKFLGVYLDESLKCETHESLFSVIC